MIKRNSLYLILVLVLISVPVFQAAHALTHVSDINTIEQGHQVDVHDETDADYDQICLDCLALTAFSIILSTLTTFSVNLIMRQQLQHIKREPILHNYFLTYLTRAPPRA